MAALGRKALDDDLAQGHLLKPFGFDRRRLAHSRLHPIGQQGEERRSLCISLGQQLSEFLRLAGGQRQGRHPEQGTFGSICSILFQHGFSFGQNVRADENASVP